jgi:flagellar biosynthetic protein FliO
MDWLQVALSLIGVLGLIMMLFYGLSKINRRVTAAAGGRLKVLDRINLGREGMLLVVSVGGKLMLLGVTSQSIRLLTELPFSEEEYMKQLPGGEGVPFAQVFAQFLKPKNKEISGEDESSEYDENSGQKK